MIDHRKLPVLARILRPLPVLLACAAAVQPGLAKDGPFALADPTYRAECASCHLAYPPALLPAASWRALLDGLGNHFGTDASVDANALGELQAFLYANAGRERRGGSGASGLRITDTDWFRREHRGVAAATWTGAAVKSRANCAACHTAAERGDYSERGIRVPK